MTDADPIPDDGGPGARWTGGLEQLDDSDAWKIDCEAGVYELRRREVDDAD